MMQQFVTVKVSVWYDNDVIRVSFKKWHNLIENLRFQALRQTLWNVKINAAATTVCFYHCQQTHMNKEQNQHVRLCLGIREDENQDQSAASKWENREKSL